MNVRSGFIGWNVGGGRGPGGLNVRKGLIGGNVWLSPGRESGGRARGVLWKVSGGRLCHQRHTL